MESFSKSPCPGAVRGLREREREATEGRTAAAKRGPWWQWQRQCGEGEGEGGWKGGGDGSGGGGCDCNGEAEGNLQSSRRRGVRRTIAGTGG